MNKRGLLTTNPILVLIAFIVVASFLLFVLDTGSTSGNSLTGSVSAFFSKPTMVSMGCVDSDGGRNVLIRGTVTKGKTVKTDSCSGNSVREWYCENGQYKYRVMKCPTERVCKAGACTRRSYR